LKNQLDDDDETNLGSKLAPEDRKELQETIDETLEWMDENPEASKEEYDEKKTSLEHTVNPIMRNMYAGGDEDMDDFGDDEL